MSISVVVIAKNAKNTIASVLKSVQFAEEVILVDIKSGDETTELAKKYTSRIYHYHEDTRFVEPVRNFAISKATKDWVLVLDADEEIPSTLAIKLQELSRSEDNHAFYLPRKNLVSGFWMQHTGWWPDYQLRFFRKGLVTWSDTIHGRPIIADKKEARILEAKEEWAILHHNYADTKDYLARFDRYTDIEAMQKSQLIGSDFIISSSTLLQTFSDDFLRRFFQKEGYLDGARGFYMSIMQAAYQMTVQMKIFDLLGNQANLEKDPQQLILSDLRHFQKDLNYWIDDLAVKKSKGIQKLFALLRRKLRR